MSTHLLRVIPAAPFWTPEPDVAGQAEALLAKLFAGRIPVAEAFDRTVFVDQGENFEEVRCPQCGAVLGTGWWGERMTEADENCFTDLNVRTPCCGTETTLNDLDYRQPAAFARFVLTVENPQRDGGPPLTADELAALGKALAHDVRQVLAHY